MNTDIAEVISTALREPTSAISYTVSRRLAGLFPNKTVLDASSGVFDLLGYAGGGQCQIQKRPEVYSQIISQWKGPGLGVDESAGSCWFDVQWSGSELSVVQVSWQDGFQPKQAVWIVADSKEVGEAFLIALSEWCSEVRDEIVVFEGGCWQKSKELFESIQATTVGNVILAPEMKNTLLHDFEHFFKSRADYERYGVPWKRGVLFYGPPGNGKTHTLKALVNWLNKPCLYVKSFEPSNRYESGHAMIRKVFSRARLTTPCLLVLEDLDSIINDNNRSFFLNELDGFAANTGIVVLATTNHPERLDPALLDRPSRFDRKYSFGLPTPEERTAYLELWNNRSPSELRLSQAGTEAVVEQTDGFSFAYLKELWLSSMMEWIAKSQAGSMDKIMSAQATALTAQMAAPLSEPAPQSDQEDQVAQIMRTFASFRGR